MKKISFVSLALLAGVSAYAAPLTPGNLLVTQLGLDGRSTVAANTGTEMVLKEINPADGSVVQSFVLPSATGATACVNSGTATSNGFLSYYNGYFGFAGYNAAAGTAAIASTAAATTGRIAGFIDMNGNIDLSTVLTDAFDGNNFREAITDGVGVWTTGAGSGTTGGLRYSLKGGTTSTLLTTVAGTGAASGLSNARNIGIWNGQLYISSQSSPAGSATTTAYYGVLSTTSQLPTAAGEAASLLPGFPDPFGVSAASTASSTYDFAFDGTSTLYTADDRTSDKGGGVLKWTLSGGTWSVAYRINAGLATNTATTTYGARGLTIAGKDGNGNNVLYVVGAQSTAVGKSTQIYKLVDTGSGASFTTVATAPTNTNFRGIRYIPVPVQTGVTLTGNLTLGNYTLAGTVPAQFKIYSGGVLKSTVTSNVTVNSSGVGTYSINAGSVSGSIDVYCVINGGTFLQKKNTVSVSGTSASSDFSLINGDIDGNNIVNINDYSVLSDHFNAPAGDPNYVANADLDKNGTININDYSILSDNFNLAGDVAP